MQGAAVAVARKGPDYGGVELKRNYQRYWVTCFAIAAAIHFGLVGGYYAYGLLQVEDPPKVSVRILRYSDLGPPPSIAASNTPPPISVSAPTAKPTVGAPVPVPDAEVSAEQTLATQTEMSQQVAPVSEGLGGEGGVEIEQDIKIDEDAPPADFVPVEKEPQVIKKVEPKYPELAMRAGLEGKSVGEDLGRQGRASVSWLGIFYLLFLASILAWIILGTTNLFHFSLDRRTLIIVLIGFSLIACFYGFWNATAIRIKTVTLPLPNLPEPWKDKTAVWISDIHLGQVRNHRFAQEITKRIQDLRPDTVFIGGDLFYGGEAMDLNHMVQPFSQISSTYGSYFITGNHEEFSDNTPYLQAVRRAGMRVLDNEKGT